MFKNFNFLLVIAFVFFLCLPAFCEQNDQLTITTYYPSPNGSYKDLNVSNSIALGTTTPRTPAPNAQAGNLDANDIWLRSLNNNAGAWLSQSITLGNAIRIINPNAFPVGLATDWPGIIRSSGWVTLTPFTFTAPSNATLFIDFTVSVHRGGTLQWNEFQILMDNAVLPGATSNWGGANAETKDTISFSRIIVTPAIGMNHTISFQERVFPYQSIIEPNEGILNVLVFYKSNWPSGVTR
ncbi:MAG: hypothetical protein NTY47_05755 [Candidatus Omnitrophica bacterium]|nr:hypothetical protein [Candidatus Omnitrophota bacterium]